MSDETFIRAVQWVCLIMIAAIVAYYSRGDKR